MSFSRIKSISYISICFKTSPKKYTFWGGGESNRIICWPAASVFTKSVWIKEKALHKRTQQHSWSSMSQPYTPTPTHTHACVPPLPRLWLYVQSASILLGCILKSTAATLGFELTEGLIKRVIKWVISSYNVRFSWKVLSETVDATTITCFFSPCPRYSFSKRLFFFLHEQDQFAGSLCIISYLPTVPRIVYF